LYLGIIFLSASLLPAVAADQNREFLLPAAALLSFALVSPLFLVLWIQAQMPAGEMRRGFARRYLATLSQLLIFGAIFLPTLLLIAAVSFVLPSDSNAAANDAWPSRIDLTDEAIILLATLGALLCSIGRTPRIVEAALGRRTKTRLEGSAQWRLYGLATLLTVLITLLTFPVVPLVQHKETLSLIPAALYVLFANIITAAGGLLFFSATLVLLLRAEALPHTGASEGQQGSGKDSGQEPLLV